MTQSMILDRLPDQPGITKTGFKFIGYWQATSGALNIDRYLREFGPGGLPHPRDFVDSSWSEYDRRDIAHYLRVGWQYESWRGNSSCRFNSCAQTHLAGYRDLTDGVYVWPESFDHYILEHSVRPPEEFIEHVLKSGKRFCRECGTPLPPAPEDAERDARMAESNKSYRAPDGSPIFHTGHPPVGWLELPADPYCKEHSPREHCPV